MTAAHASNNVKLNGILQRKLSHAVFIATSFLREQVLPWSQLPLQHV